MQTMTRFLSCVVIVAFSATTSAGKTCGSTVGRWGYGPARAVATSGDLAYFGSGIYLMVAQIRAEGEIAILAELELPDIVAEIEVRDGIAYIAASSSGLILVDVTEPASPMIVSRLDTPGNALRVALDGDIALIADHRGGLRLVDIRDTDHPREISSMDFSRPVDEAVPIGGYAYVATSSMIRIIDISRPSDPVSVGSFQPNTIVNVITIHDELALIGTSYRGLQIYDATHPTDPVWLGEYNNFEDEYEAIAVHGDHVFLGPLGVGALDISDPTNPVRTTYRSTGSTGNYARGLAMIGDLLVAANEGDGLLVFDFSSGQYLAEMESYDVPRRGNAIAVSGSTVYLGSELEGGDGIRAFDIDRPSKPVLLGSTLDLDRATGFRDLVAVGDHLYSVWPLTVIDVSDPATPTPAAYFDEQPAAIEVAAGHLFTTSLPWYEASDLRIYNLTDPVAPLLIGSALVPGVSMDLAVDGDLVFVVSRDGLDDSDGGLYIFDVNTITEPTLIGSLQTPVYANAIAVEDALVFIADQWDLRVVDVSNPSLPFQVGVIRLEGEWPKAIDVAVSDGVALVADSGGDFTFRQYVHVIDVSDPAAPRERTRFPLDTTDIKAADGLFYIADKDGGFRIYDPSTPCREVFVREIPVSHID